MAIIEQIKTEIERQLNDKKEIGDLGGVWALQDVLSFLDTLEEPVSVPVQDVSVPPVCEDVSKERSLSLQIQAYLNTCSDELYAEGKPLYSEYRQKEIHDCMAMWKKLHDYFFYNKPFQSVCEGLEEEISRTYHNGSVTDTSDLDHNSYENIARHFARWGAEHLDK